MKKTFIAATITIVIILSACGLLWIGNQPKVTYYPNNNVKSSIERKFFKENGEGRLYNEEGQKIYTYHAVNGIKEGAAKISFSDGEILFSFADNKISGDVKFDVDEDAKELTSLSVKSFAGTLKIKKEFEDASYIKATAEISCDDDWFMTAVYKYAQERNNKHFVQLAKCLNIEKIQYKAGDIECNMSGHFEYPDFSRKSTIECALPNEGGEIIHVKAEISNNDMHLNAITDGNIKTDVSAVIVKNNEIVLRTLINLLKKYQENTEPDYKTFVDLFGNLEVKKLNFSMQRIKCEYAGGFRYPRFTQNTNLTCTYNLSPDEIKNIGSGIDTAGMEKAKISMQYNLKNNKILYKGTLGKTSVKFYAENINELIPIYTKYAFSSDNQDNNKYKKIRWIIPFIKHFGISDYEFVMNGKKTAEINGSLSLLNGLSGTAKSKLFIDNAEVLSAEIKNRIAVLKLNYLQSGKPFVVVNVKFKDNVHKTYKRLIDTIIRVSERISSTTDATTQAATDSVFDRARTQLISLFEQTRKKIQPILLKLNDLIYTIDSIEGSLYDYDGKKIIDIKLKLKPGIDFYEAKQDAEIFDVYLYPYLNGKAGQTVKVADKKFYVNDEIISKEQFYDIIHSEKIESASEKFLDSIGKNLHVRLEQHSVSWSIFSLAAISATSAFIVYAASVDSSNDYQLQAQTAEEFVKQYVSLRTNIVPDSDEMTKRWLPDGILNNMSSDDVYEKFAQNTARQLLQKLREDGLTCKVTILNVKQVEDDIWHVEYIANYSLPSAEYPKSIKYRSALKLEQKGNRFKVVAYGSKQIDE